MRIEQLSSVIEGEMARVSAKIIWEDCGRPAQELYFETIPEFADGLSCNPDAFLTACALPAMREGEKRISIDGEICPELRDGLTTVMSWMRHWHYGRDKSLVNIEAKSRTGLLAPKREGRAGLFLSGGVDSLATLRANHLNYPREHPGFIRDGLIVCGLEVPLIDKFQFVVSHLSEIARSADVSLIPIYTNVRDMGPKDTGEFWSDFWVNEFEGAAFSSIAHAFSNRLSTVFYSSSYDIPNLFIWGKTYFTGSHPLIDPNYSSGDLSIKHFGIFLSRYEKTKLIADWDVALKHLRVCNKSREYESRSINCGECEKCLRTKLALLALGVLDSTTAFVNKDINAELLESNIVLSKVNFNLYEDLLEPLSSKGYHQYARIIKNKLAKKRLALRMIEPIKDLDRKYLNSNLLKLKKLVYKKGISY